MSSVLGFAESTGAAAYTAVEGGSGVVVTDGGSSCCCEYANEYSGWGMLADDDTRIAEYELTDVDAVVMAGFVAARRPVILNGILPGVCRDSFTLRRLVERADSSSVVHVEHRASDRERFGRGRRLKMQFKDFAQAIAGMDSSSRDGNCSSSSSSSSGGSSSSSTQLYLTSQPLPQLSDGRPDVMAPPLRQMRDAFPARPPLLGHLIPASYNLWLGRTHAGTSSGLHHDFHDNLYVLLHGHKHFRLFCPSDAHRMYTRGTIARVYPNGRIVYSGQPPVTADGVDTLSAAQAAVTAAEAALKRATMTIEQKQKQKQETLGQEQSEQRQQQQLQQGGFQQLEPQSDDDGAAILAGLQAKLEAAIEAKLEAELDAVADGSDGSILSDQEEAEKEEEGEYQDEMSNGADETLVAVAPTAASGTASDIAAAASELRDDIPDPPSFSRIQDVDAPETTVKFPLYKEAREFTCELSQGQMLYLPAGWFHEVTSLGTSASGIGGGKEKAKGIIESSLETNVGDMDKAAATTTVVSTQPPPAATTAPPSTPSGIHMALNYWFHPPTARTAEEVLDAPYGQNAYWPQEWAERATLFATSETGNNGGRETPSPKKAKLSA